MDSARLVDDALIVFLKYPESGRVKTRLARDVGDDVAVRCYRASVEVVLGMTARVADVRRFIAYSPEGMGTAIREMVGPGFELFPQEGDDLGMRMHHAFERVLGLGHQSAVILGTDSPTLPADKIPAAFDALRENDVVLGPAEDGGYYLIGLRGPTPRLFEDIRWSTSSVLDATLARAAELRMRHYLLASWYDIDTLKDLRRAIGDDGNGFVQTLRRHLVGVSVPGLELPRQAKLSAAVP